MNAVNLIPLERRRADTPSLPGAPFLGLVGVLVVALAATFLYVSADNRVSTRQAELSRIHAGTNAWSAAAARYAPAVAGLKHDASRFTQVDGLLSQRANWSLLLTQLAGAMPAQAQLDSLSASGPTAGGTTTASTASSASTTGGAATASSGINITGCAASEPVVADTMIALRRLSGVSAVNLLSSVATSSNGTGSSVSGGGACSGDDFTLSLQFTPVVGLAQVLGTKATAAASTASASSTPSTSSSATTSQTTSTSTPTGAAQ
jgi:Tfp pilus assembly protein PilN